MKSRHKRRISCMYQIFPLNDPLGRAAKAVLQRKNRERKASFLRVIAYLWLICMCFYRSRPPAPGCSDWKIQSKWRAFSLPAIVRRVVFHALFWLAAPDKTGPIVTPSTGNWIIPLKILKTSLSSVAGQKVSGSQRSPEILMASDHRRLLDFCLSFFPGARSNSIELLTLVLSGLLRLLTESLMRNKRLSSSTKIRHC